MTQTTVGAAAPRGGVLDDVVLTHVITMGELDAFRRWLGERHDGMVCWDTESDGLRPEHDRHRMTQIGDKRHGWAFPPGWFGAAHEALSCYPGRLGTWNGPYDVRVLGCQDGLWMPWAQLDDGQLVAHLADSAAMTALKPRAARDIDPTALVWDRQLSEAMRKNHWDYATVPDDYPGYWQYGAGDTVLTSWLLDAHLPAIRAKYAAAYDLELAYARCCAGMMTAGMMIDRPWIADWTAKITSYYQQAMGWLAAWGITSVEANADVGAALERAGVPITHRTSTGKIKVDKATLEEYQASYPHAAELISTIRTAKKAASLLSRVLDKFGRMAGPDDVMHYSINSIGAQRTSRSSVSEPSMQNLDRDIVVVRGCYIPRPGHVFVTWDANQIEMRLAAHFSGDRQLISDFLMCDRTGQSFFVNMAERIYRTKIAKSDQRYTMTKNTSYAMVYGSGLATAANTAGVAIGELRPIYDGFLGMYPQLKRMMNAIVEQCKRSRGRPKISTLYGRELTVDRGREYSACDYRVQGSAAELMKRGVIAMDAHGYGPLLRLTVHDELIAEVPIADAQDVLRAGTEILTDRTSFAVPITWDGQIIEGRWHK
jgi:DNA polymerase-1